MQKLLSRDENINNPELRSIYNKITSKKDYFTMFVDGAADLHSKTSGIGGVIYKDEEEMLMEINNEVKSLITELEKKNDEAETQ